MKSIIIIFLISICTIAQSFNIPVNTDQYLLLKEISNNAEVGSQWTDQDIQNCNIPEITCKSYPDADYVYNITITNSYKGKLSNDLRPFKKLEYLYINSEVGQGIDSPNFPDSLKEITLINTLFRSSIQYSIMTSNLVKLIIINSSFEFMSDLFFENSPNIEEITISNNNNLKGNLPKINPTNLNNLKIINLQNNLLIGGIPDNLMDILYKKDGSNRAVLDLRQNKLNDKPTVDALCQSMTGRLLFNDNTNFPGAEDVVCNYSAEITRPANYSFTSSSFCIKMKYQESVSIRRLDTNTILDCYPYYDPITKLNNGTCCTTYFNQTWLGKMNFIIDPLNITFSVPLERPYPYNTSTVSKYGGPLSISGYNLPSNVSILQVTVNQHEVLVIDYIYKDGTANLTVNMGSAFMNVTSPVATIQFFINNNDYILEGIPISFLVFNDVKLSCPGTPECSGNGKCIDGYCECIGYIGKDCSTKILDNSTIDVTNLTGPTINSRTSFSDYNISITMVAVQELNYLMEVVKEISLSGVWNSSTSSIYQKTYYSYNKNAEFMASVETFDGPTTYPFGTEKMKMDEHTVKFSFKITNWDWTSPLNALRIVYSTGFVPKTSNDDAYLCEDGSDSTKSSSTENILNPDSLKSTMIQSNEGMTINARFSSIAIVDGRIVLVNNTLISAKSNVAQLGITVPYFEKECIVDPDFSVFLTDDYSGCKTTSGMTKKIIIIVTSVVFGVALLVTISLYIYMKHRQRQLKLKILNISDRINNEANNRYSK